MIYTQFLKRPQKLLVVNNHSLFVAKFARYLLQIHQLLIIRCKTTRYSLQNSLVTRCRNCLLQKITRYSLQNFLVARCRGWLLQKATRYLLQNSLVARCRSRITFCNFIKMRLQHRCFPMNFCYILKTPNLQNIGKCLFLKIISKRQQTFQILLKDIINPHNCLLKNASFLIKTSNE